MKALLTILGNLMLLLACAEAIPESKNVSTTRAIIESVHPADTKSGTPGYVTVKPIGRESYRTYRVFFDKMSAVPSDSRKHGRSGIPFDQLKAGYEIRFSEVAINDAISPDENHCTVFTP
jgi:hypothetical protein